MTGNCYLTLLTNDCLRYDKTFEGLLTVVFDAYYRRTFPDVLFAEGEPLPLFVDDSFTVIADEEKSTRVWAGLQKNYQLQLFRA